MGHPCQSFGRKQFTPRSYLLKADVNRYSGFTNLLPEEWAGTASYHGCALPTELSRLVALTYTNGV